MAGDEEFASALPSRARMPEERSENAHSHTPLARTRRSCISHCLSSPELGDPSGIASAFLIAHADRGGCPPKWTRPTHNLLSRPLYNPLRLLPCRRLPFVPCWRFLEGSRQQGRKMAMGMHTSTPVARRFTRHGMVAMFSLMQTLSIFFRQCPVSVCLCLCLCCDRR
jgi:hypothetical protein